MLKKIQEKERNKSQHSLLSNQFLSHFCKERAEGGQNWQGNSKVVRGTYLNSFEPIVL